MYSCSSNSRAVGVTAALQQSSNSCVLHKHVHAARARAGAQVGERTATVGFLTGVLGMQVLRHEEFEEGCAAACNGPYDGRWSKTMIGYGDESSHFVLELTYNYGVKEYHLGTDFGHVEICSSELHEKLPKVCAPTQVGRPHYGLHTNQPVSSTSCHQWMARAT